MTVTINGAKCPVPTIEDRHMIYKEALNTLTETVCGPFICNVVSKLYREKFLQKSNFAPYVDADLIIKHLFSEVYNKLEKISDVVIAWPMNDEWNEHRADVLAACIAETSKND